MYLCQNDVKALFEVVYLCERLLFPLVFLLKQYVNPFTKPLTTKYFENIDFELFCI
jgi:hypothetical protein